MQLATLPPPAFARVLLVAAVLGVAVGAGFELFETSSAYVRDLVWVDLAGEQPSALVTVLLATIGGLAVGLTLLLVPGHGGAHPGDGHELQLTGAPASLSTAAGTLVAGFVALVAGASLGPEGALIAATLGFAGWAARRARVPTASAASISGAALAALVAAMFGSPLAGAVPILEVAPLSGTSLVVVILPSLVASSTAVLTLQVFGAEAAGFLQLGYEGFHGLDLVWALAIGTAAGALGIAFAGLLPVLRRLARRLESIHLLAATTAGGLAVGGLYAIAGTEIRFSGIPELQLLIASTDTSIGALVAVGAKLLATAVCLAVGYRGGMIFPLAFAGGALGLAVHLAVDAVPLAVAVGAGLAGVIAVGLKSPVTAALITAALVGPELLPMAILAVVVAYTIFLLGDQLVVNSTASPSPQAIES